MKNKIIKFSLGLLIIGLTACEKNDPIDDIARIGEVAPHVYWELPSTSVVAGNPVPFRAQYYSTTDPIDRLEIWYSIFERLEFSAMCPLVKTFTYTLSVDTTTQVRIFQKISEYAHNETNWDADKKAYILNDQFPTSSTLRPIEWAEKYDEEKFRKLFPEGFDVQFKEGLYPKLQVDDFRSMMVALDYMTDSTFVEDYMLVSDEINPNTGKYDISIRPEKVDELKQMFDQTPFEKLVYRPSDQVYVLSYTKSYSLEARFKAFDTAGIEGYAEKKTIELQ